MDNVIKRIEKMFPNESICGIVVGTDKYYFTLFDKGEKPTSWNLRTMWITKDLSKYDEFSIYDPDSEEAADNRKCSKNEENVIIVHPKEE